MKDFLKRGKFELLGLALLQFVWYELGHFLAFEALASSPNAFIIGIAEVATVSLILWHIFYRTLTKNHKSAIVCMVISLIISLGLGTYFGMTVPFSIELRIVGTYALTLLSLPGTLSSAMFMSWIFQK